MKASLDLVMESMKHGSAGGEEIEANPVVLTEEQKQRLRALGYLE